MDGERKDDSQSSGKEKEHGASHSDAASKVFET